MSQSLRETESFKDLQQIFPNWKVEPLYSIFEANGYDVDMTVQSILTIENVDSSSNRENRPPRTNQSSQSKPHRGRPCKLPDDFLRPPNWQPVYDVDEQLALTLQREMFSEQEESKQQRSQTFKDIESLPDLGIFKAISSFGEVAKKNIDYLVSKITVKNEPYGRHAVDEAVELNQPVISEMHENRILTDDDDDETISFRSVKKS